ncbi:MAG TPA: polysaccharide biosynthesis protein, partial [Firmicutes bacterium]|nr:polysaccharide biosynthesis protein [Bacillota bacterium]
MGSSRMFIRVLQYLRQKRLVAGTNLLIVGAGDAGAMIAREILNSQFCASKKLVGFIDDAKAKTGRLLLGAKVLGTRKEIGKIVERYKVNEIIIAMPSVAGDIIREIFQQCKSTGCIVKTLPGIYELIDGKVTVQQLRSVEIKDLLRRDPIKLDL